MGQKQSKDQLLYQQVSIGNVESIKALHRQGAGLEWRDREGNTPLIVACMNSQLYDVARTLIQLGANVNARSLGCHSGTPLHHAAKKGLNQTVKLLLTNGANALVKNDVGKTPLDIARVKGHSNVVRVIESHICLFSGWLRELYGPGFLELLAPQWLSRKIWVVVVPCASRNRNHSNRKPLKLQLAIYPSPKDARPRITVALRKAKVEEPKLRQLDPAVTIFDKATAKRYKLASANESDKQQLQCFSDACRGISQAAHPPLSLNSSAPVAPVTKPSTTEDVELAMAINASILSAMEERPSCFDLLSEARPPLSPNSSAPVAPVTKPSTTEDVELAMAINASILFAMEERPSCFDLLSEAASSSGSAQSNIPIGIMNPQVPNTASTPSAPPVPEGADYGFINYPSVAYTAINLDMLNMITEEIITSEVKRDVEISSKCVICLDAPIEGACVPCGHMAGCMSCLKEIKAKKLRCPVCRAKIDQVIRLYTV